MNRLRHPIEEVFWGDVPDGFLEDRTDTGVRDILGTSVLSGSILAEWYNEHYGFVPAVVFWDEQKAAYCYRNCFHSLIFGALYEQFGALVAFGWGAGLALVAVLILLAVRLPTETEASLYRRGER